MSDTNIASICDNPEKFVNGS